MVKIAAATLVYSTQDLADAMRAMLPEVYVIDNGSPTPIVGAHYRLPNNLYFSGGWNAAARWAKASGYDALWMLNSDVSGDLQGCLRRLSQAMPGRVVVSPVLPGCGHVHMRPARGLHKQGCRRARWLDWVAPLVKLDWFLALNGFDQAFPGWCADVDLCWRGRHMGRYAVCNDARIEHAWGETCRRTGDKTMQRLDEARTRLVTKHGPAIRTFAPSVFKPPAESPYE